MLVQGLFPLLALAGAALGQYVIDDFKDSAKNSRGNYHGCDAMPGMKCEWGSGGLTITSSDTDYSFYTQFDNGGCQDMSSFGSQYLHIKFSGSSAFTIALQQNNPSCSSAVAPYPETWDVVNAADYASGEHIYVPMSHFNIDKSRALAVALKAFREPGASTTFSLAEIVQSVPSGSLLFSGPKIPQKKPTGPLYFACTRPNSIAFGIDDGVPQLAPEIMEIIKNESIKVTFFTVGNALDNPSTGFANLYKKAEEDGHQIAFHSYSHPKIEGLNDIAKIDEEIKKSYDSTRDNVGTVTKYFRAPFGTDGALTRQRLEVIVPGAKVINWSVDIEDWKHAGGDPTDMQTAAVNRDLDKGGNLFVAHYLYPDTVRQFHAFIQAAKRTKKKIMRIDQCLEDPSAPPL